MGVSLKKKKKELCIEDIIKLKYIYPAIGKASHEKCLHDNNTAPIFGIDNNENKR